MNAMVRSTVFGVVVIAAMGFVTAAPLVEASPRFHGTYAWTGFRACVVATQPFVGPDFLIPAGAFLPRQNSSESGTITFDKDGTGVTEGRASLMTISTTAGPSVSVAEFEITSRSSSDRTTPLRP